MSILQEIREYKNCAIKERFVAYIKDTTISIENRWEVFIEAPSDWKNKKSFIQSFNVEKKLKNKEISWYDDFCIEKNETVDMQIIVESLERNFKSEDIEENGWTKALIVEFKEEILKKNLSSFDYDW